MKKKWSLKGIEVTDYVMSVTENDKEITISFKEWGTYSVYPNRKKVYTAALSLLPGEKITFLAQGKQIISLCRATKPR